MRKNLLSLVALATVVFSSCSKQKEIAKPDEKLYPLSISVSTFDTQIVGMGAIGKLSMVKEGTTASSNNLSGQISRLDYLIYNSSGVLMKNTYQTTGTNNFGTIKENLPAGDYKIYLLGGNGATSFSNTEDNKSLHVNSGPYSIGDLFIKSSDIKVSIDTTSQSLTLERAVGKLDVQLTDAVPANIAKITVTSSSSTAVHYNKPSFEFGSMSSSVDGIVSTTDIGKKNFVISKYVVPTYSGSIISNVTIRAYDSTGLLIADKLVNNVKVEKNKKTILSGELFTQPVATGATGFAIKVNSQWDTQTNNVSF